VEEAGGFLEAGLDGAEVRRRTQAKVVRVGVGEGAVGLRTGLALGCLSHAACLAGVALCVACVV